MANFPQSNVPDMFISINLNVNLRCVCILVLIMVLFAMINTQC